MARLWTEPYTHEKAARIGIHDHEDSLILGPPHARRIYYVEVCRFRFAFYSLAMIREYLDYFQQKIVPSSRFPGPFSGGAAAGVGGGQSRFERLPMRLRKEPNRLKVVKALERALIEFGGMTT